MLEEILTKNDSKTLEFKENSQSLQKIIQISRDLAAKHPDHGLKKLLNELKIILKNHLQNSLLIHTVALIMMYSTNHFDLKRLLVNCLRRS